MNAPSRRYRTIFISDLHLGSRGCQAEALARFLKANTAERLVLVGDVVDGWRLRAKWFWPQSHTNVVRRILTAAKRDTEVTYIVGNHDEVLRGFLRYRVSFGRIRLCNRIVHEGADGKRYLVLHGDLFDRHMLADGKLLKTLGDNVYDLAVWLNVKLNRVRKRFGLPYWSLSRHLRDNSKRAAAYVERYEGHVAEYAHRKGFDGVICGHIHVAAIKALSGVVYMNDGDWVESCTALVEHHDGRWELVSEPAVHA
ncbi:UDP-2,3-diacylglucosamine diphosphatase [Parvularcula dongshanensis]|uniref:UDP-2,3-diacylglucosamine pyrophosphatase LpxH n=1 Tax=Parvularcula dongshanensis TaxID=1173995 RepID=A0A840I3G5_9PROT|nr:UDP-2,3-diacylglucosamine diphosphatase [Parvularcula dongshanensis]MBB4658865.1 UDP-2,3-diacylglucosamine pyrophosphatase LpxH [Parvularcula dongshanensis]